MKAHTSNNGRDSEDLIEIKRSLLPSLITIGGPRRTLLGAALVGCVCWVSGCANTNGYNGPPYYPYNAYPYPQQQYGTPGTFQPGGVYPAPATGVPMVPTPGAPAGSPGLMPGGVMPGTNYPTGMAPPPGYNNVPTFNSGSGSGPGQPFIGS